MRAVGGWTTGSAVSNELLLFELDIDEASLLRQPSYHGRCIAQKYCPKRKRGLAAPFSSPVVPLIKT
jgi:hypothetical protein